MLKQPALSALLSVLLLAGCAAQQAYKEGERLLDSGKVEEGLMQMGNASKLEPDNSEYRSRYFKRREAAVFQWLSQAETAKNKGAWEEAEGCYQRILRIDPENPRAKTGLSVLNSEKKQALLLEEARLLLEKNDLTGAGRKVRQILVDSPSHPDGLKLQRTIEAKNIQANQMGTVLKSRLTRPITIEFKDAPVQAVFELIARTAGINFIFDKEVRPDLRANLFVRDARIEDVIRFVLVTNQLEQRVLNESTLFIYPNSPQKLKDFQELQVRNFYIVNADAKQTAAMIKGLVKTKDIYVDEKLNLIMMRDTPEAIRVAERLVAAQDMAEPEVMLEVEVLEVGTSLLRELGIRYPEQISYSVVGAAGTPGTVTLPELINRNAGLVRVSISNPALIVNLRNQEGDTNLLANPKIRVKNHEKAKIHIGDKVPIITNTTTATGVIAESVSYLDVGLKLDVEPTIYLANEVGIKIGLEVSNIVREVRSAGGTLTYQVGTRNAATTLRLKDGETQILAGLISKEDRKTSNKVPGLGQLPVIGRLFSSDADTIAKTEVVLLITPRVVSNIIRPESPIEEFSSGTESVIGLNKLEIQKAQAGTVHSTFSSEVAPVALEATNVQAADNPPQALGNVQLILNSPTSISTGKEFTVSINLVADNMQNALLDLSFDPSKLKIIKVEEGDFPGKPDGNTRFMHQVQDRNGHVNFSVVRQGNVQGHGALASVTFQPLAGISGRTELRIAAANFSDAAGKVLPINALPVASLEISQ